jgi:hypothetical protein
MGSQDDSIDDSRRQAISGMLGATALLGLASCVDEDGTSDADAATIPIEATGAPVGWVDAIGTVAAPLDLRSLAQGAYEVVIAKGFATPGDGGGGVFHWTADTNTPDDGGTVIAHTSMVMPPPERTGCWKRAPYKPLATMPVTTVFTGPVSVRHFGALGSGADDAPAINAAVAVAALGGGGSVLFPAGTYATSSRILVDGSRVALIGVGQDSRIAPSSGATFDTIVVNSAGGNGRQRGNAIRGLWLDERFKNGGRAIYAQRVDDFHIADVYVDHPCQGIHLHNFNGVVVERTRVAVPGCGNSYGCWLTGGGTGDSGRSDVIDFKDVVFTGDPAATDTSRHGLIVDGFVNTVSAHKLYFVNTNGAGLWFRNQIGASQNPQFAAIYGLEADFPRLQGILAQVGQRLHFTDCQLHGSRTESNIQIANGVNTVSVKGGFSSGAAKAGMELGGQQISVQGMDVLANSTLSLGTYPGIEVLGTARMITLVGNKLGDPSTASYQSYGLKINSGAAQFVVTSNVVFHNVNAGILNSAGTSASKVVASNAI